MNGIFIIIIFFKHHLHFVFFLCFRKYLEYGLPEDFRKLRMYFERREVLSHWLKENLWLISVLGEGVVRSLRPPMLAPDYSFPVLGNDPVACLVQR